MAEQPRLVLCPYCGAISAQLDRCASCKGFFEPLSRRATQIAMGPWYVRDKANPFRPGCTYAVIKRQVEVGRIKPTTVMRGPTTRQFWTLARATPGVAHLLGYCHRCGIKANPTDPRCPSCKASFKEPKQRNELGLAFPTETVAAAAQKALDRDRERILAAQGGAAANASAGTGAGQSSVTQGTDGRSRTVGSTGSSGASSRSAGALLREAGSDLLDEVLSEIPSDSADGDGKRRMSRRSSSGATPAAASSAQAIDFTPVDAAAADGPEAQSAAPRSTGGISWSIVAALALVVAILIGVVIWLVMIVSDLQTNRTTPSSPAPAANAHFGRAAPAPISRNAAKPGDSSATPPSAATPPAPAAPPKPAGMSEQAVKAKITEAQLVEDEGKPAEALAILQAAVRGVPTDQQPREIQTEIRRLQLELEKAKTPDEESP